jgi:hypothetical protein
MASKQSKCIHELNKLVERARDISVNLDPYNEHSKIANGTSQKIENGVVYVYQIDEGKEYQKWNTEIRSFLKEYKLNDRIEQSFWEGLSIDRQKTDASTVYRQKINLALEKQMGVLEKIREDLITESKIENVDIKGSKYSNADEDIPLTSIGIRIKNNLIIRGNKKIKINPTDRALIYHLYYKSRSNKEECCSLKDLSEVTGKAEGYIKNRITNINRLIKEIILKGVQSKIVRFIVNGKNKRGYHLNPRIIHKKKKG